MKIKHAALLTLCFIIALHTACRRTTPHDSFFPDPNCGKLGYYSDYYDAGFDAGYIFSSYATLAVPKTIVSLSVNMGGTGTNSAQFMIYDGADNSLIFQSDVATVSEGWNTIDIRDTLLPAGEYRLAVQVRYTNLWIRMEQDKGTVYWQNNSWGIVPSTLSPGTGWSFAMHLYGTYCD